MSQFGFRLQAAVDNAESQSQAEAMRVDELTAEIAERVLGRQVFDSAGWEYVSKRLNQDVEDAERRILSGELEGDAQRSAYVRGQIAAFRFLLDFDSALKQEIDTKQEEIDELT